MPWVSGVYPQFFGSGPFYGPLPEIGALRGPSQRALGHTMVQKLVKLVALATFLPRKLAFLVPQHSLSEQVAAAALWPASRVA